MSEAVQPIKANTPNEPARVRLVGRIKATRVHQGTHYTTMILPAASAFDHPGTVVVQSGAQLGAVGTDVQLDARVGGYRDAYRTRDGEQVEGARITLTALSLG